MKNMLIDLICYLFILLFLYTGGMKLLSRHDFYLAMNDSPLLYRYSALVSWIIPILELAIVACLTIPKLKRIGLYASLILMALFTIYAIYNAFFLINKARPCTCGGIIQDMTWNQHVVFNTVFTLLALFAILLYSKKNRELSRFNETRNLSLS